MIKAFAIGVYTSLKFKFLNTIFLTLQKKKRTSGFRPYI